VTFAQKVIQSKLNIALGSRIVRTEIEDNWTRGIGYPKVSRRTEARSIILNNLTSEPARDFTSSVLRGSIYQNDLTKRDSCKTSEAWLDNEFGILGANNDRDVLNRVFG
jgi:hypothetical protein